MLANAACMAWGLILVLTAGLAREYDANTYGLSRGTCFCRLVLRWYILLSCIC